MCRLPGTSVDFFPRNIFFDHAMFGEQRLVLLQKLRLKPYFCSTIDDLVKSLFTQLCYYRATRDGTAQHHDNAHLCYVVGLCVPLQLVSPSYVRSTTLWKAEEQR